MEQDNFSWLSVWKSFQGCVTGPDLFLFTTQKSTGYYFPWNPSCLVGIPIMDYNGIFCKPYKQTLRILAHRNWEHGTEKILAFRFGNWVHPSSCSDVRRARIFLTKGSIHPLYSLNNQRPFFSLLIKILGPWLLSIIVCLSPTWIIRGRTDFYG